MKSPPESRAAGSAANLASGDYAEPSKSLRSNSTEEGDGATLRAYVLSRDLLVVEAVFGPVE